MMKPVPGWRTRIRPPEVYVSFQPGAMHRNGSAPSVSELSPDGNIASLRWKTKSAPALQQSKDEVLARRPLIHQTAELAAERIRVRNYAPYNAHVAMTHVAPTNLTGHKRKHDDS